MAYSTANPPRLQRQVPGGNGRRLWSYENTDSVATVRAAGYITNAKRLGMKAGDLVDYLKTDDNTSQLMRVLSVNASTGVADLSDGTAITATNT